MKDNYGKCKDCGLEIETKADANEHMSSTMAPIEGAQGMGETASSHSISVLNPPREDVVRTGIHIEISTAMEALAEELARKVERGRYTIAEVRDGIAGYPDIEDAWDAIESEVTEP